MTRRILVVEDSPTQAALIRLLLEGAGYQVDLAANGREGLERVQIEPPDLIISDVMMPEMDGYAFCQAVKSAERTRRIPFVLLTQRNTPEDILRGLTRGADNFIPKPFDDEYLLERVKRIFEHLEFRRKGQLDINVTLRVGDRELVINADKQQIVELLFATFDDVCKLNQMLLDAERKLEDYTLHLEAKVQERTEALRVSHRFLEIANRHGDLIPLLEEFVSEVQDITGCAAVGIRILDKEGNIPYQAYRGFEQRFYERESPLSIKSDQCMCINVIKGTTDPRLPFYTQHGSFYANGTTRLLATVSEEEKGRTRNACNQFGYESVALIPIRMGVSMLGLIHVADPQENKVPLHMVEALEKAAAQLGPAIQRVRAEEDLRESEERFQAFMQNFPGLAYMKDSDGRIVFVNEGFTRYLGLNPADMLGKTDYDFFPAEFAEKITADDRRVRESGGNQTIEVEFAGRTWDTYKFPISQPGAPPLLGGLTIDNTARKRAEEALRESEEKFRNLVEAISDWAWEVNEAGRYTYASPRIRDILGYASEEVLGQSPFDLMPPDEAKRVAEIFAPISEARKPFGLLENVNLHKDGHRVVLETSGTPIFDSQGVFRGYRGIDRDITARKRLEEERTRLEAHLRQQQKLEAIGTLAGGVAHEINNPIMGVMNYAQLIADTVAPGSQTAEYAGEIIHETERVATIVRNLLQFARQEKQSHSLARTADIVEQTLSLIRAVFRRDQITVEVDVPEELPGLKCRSQQLQQVLMNLLTNARDALNEKYPGYHADKTIQVSCRPFEHEGRPWLRLTVADHGPGIPAEIQERIFEPFFTTKPRDQGTGLGLSISHGIVQDRHGALHFETEPGQGTRFHLDLPVDNGWGMESEKEQ